MIVMGKIDVNLNSYQMLQADRVAESLAESHLKVQLYVCLCAPSRLSSNYTHPSWGELATSQMPLTFLTRGTGITVCSMTRCGHKALDTVTQMRVWDAANSEKRF